MPLKLWKKSIIILSAHIKHSTLLINAIMRLSVTKSGLLLDRTGFLASKTILSWLLKQYILQWSEAHLYYDSEKKRLFISCRGLIVWDQKNDVITRHGQNIKLLSLSLTEGVVCILQGGIGGCRFWLYPHTNTPDPTNQTPAESGISTIRCKRAARELNHWVQESLEFIFKLFAL